MAAMAITAQGANLYGDSAGSNRIDVIDSATGALIRSCSPAKGNGRGMVVVGNIGYFTTADSGIVYKLDINTCADLGTAFTVAGASSISTLAYDGANFWLGDYTPGSKKAFQYSPTGALLKTISLANCTGNCDGLEYFNGKLISNRGDAVGPYDVYDLNGTLLTASFITPTFSPTGIAFDGTNFFVSDVYGGKVAVYDGTTGALIKTMTLTNGTGFLIEDLSVDYSQRQDTGGTPPPPSASTEIPTMSEWAMIAMMALLLSAGILALRRRS